MWGKDMHAQMCHFWDENGYALCGRVANCQRIIPEMPGDFRCKRCQARLDDSGNAQKGTLHTIQWSNPYTDPPAGAPRVLAEVFTLDRQPPPEFMAFKATITLGGGYSWTVQHIAPPPVQLSRETLAGVRKKRLERRVRAKTPMFADLFIGQEIGKKPDYYAGITDPEIQRRRDEVLAAERERYNELMSRPNVIVIYATEPTECKERAAQMLQTLRGGR